MNCEIFGDVSSKENIMADWNANVTRIQTPFLETFLAHDVLCLVNFFWIDRFILEFLN